MQVSVEKVNDSEYRLTIEVPANQVAEAYAKQIELFAKKANVKGFRPGKAPMSYITQRFGEDAHKEAVSDVMQQALIQALTENKLNPVSAPRVEPKAVSPDQPLEFIASIEVLPKVEHINFKLDKIEKLNVTVTPDDIEQVIAQLQKQQAKWNIVDRPAQQKDRVVIDYYAIFEGKSDIENKMLNVPIEIGSKTMLEGFEEGLLGVKSGDEKTLHVTFPTDFAIAEKAGKPIDFIVNVKNVFEADMPVIDEAFVNKLGVKSGSLEDLKHQINQSLDQERDRLVKEKLKEQIFKPLLEQNPLDVPKSLVANEARHIHDELYPQHQHSHDHHHSAEETKAFSELAAKRVALGLLISEFAKQNNLKVDPNKVLERIREIAAPYEHPEEVVQWLSQDERRAGIEGHVLEDMVLDKLMEGLEIIEKTMSYTELRGMLRT